MGKPERRRRRFVGVVVGAVVGLTAVLTAGCGPAGPPPPPEPSATPGPVQPFTVATTDPVRTTDPAAVSDAAASVVVLNVFQRLMTTEAGQTALKPDAARDCVFTARTVYTCTLNTGTAFHNGHALTSSDVKFSIERARRLAVAGSSTFLLDSLRRIETPDQATVRFVLRRIDTQFAYALAAPAASIVDEQVYPSDRVRPVTAGAAGSGPFRVLSRTERSLALQRYEGYVGKNPAQVERLTYRTVADSAQLEDALAARQVDVVGRGLSVAALTRYQRQVATSGRLTDDGYTVQSQSGTRVRMLQWSSASAARVGQPVRTAVVVALQADRTANSVVPGGVSGSVGTFALGGRATPTITWEGQIRLSLGYDPTMPDGVDLADQVKNRLEATGAFAVQIRARVSGNDLTILDRKAWTATPLAWLQPYLVAPPSDTASLVDKLLTRYVTATDPVEADRVLGILQRQAASDAVVVPLTQSEEYQLVRNGSTVPADSFGPGWQLGLWWMRRG